MKITFEKYQGAGNDFIIVDNRKKQFIPAKETIGKLCNRHFGIGADGLILLENDAESDFFMRYYNADGLEGSMCGNGGRCVALFAHKHGIIENDTVFHAMDGYHKAGIIISGESDAMVRLSMIDVENVMQKNDQWLIDSGSPHLLIPVDDIDNVDVVNDGRKIRHSELFADEGINVNFIQIDQDGVRLRTYERGVEDETLACGTGAVAAALVAVSGNYEIDPPVDVKALGGSMRIFLNKSGEKFTNIWIEGPATCVFKGEIIL